MNINREMIEDIRNADAILISAANGFSISEGIHLFANNQAMHDLFGDYQQKYGLPNILSGMMGKWPTDEEMWGFWSRLITHYCAGYQPSQLMIDLKKIISDKEYFIVTSNGEQHFEMAGFDENKIYEIEGDWLHMACSNGCHNEVYPCLDLAIEMNEKSVDGYVPTELLPRCPHCGAVMRPNLQVDQHFVHNDEARERYQAFLNRYKDQKIVIMELGIGARNQLIKAPLMRYVQRAVNATYISINLGELYIPQEIAHQSYGIDGYLTDALAEIAKSI